MKINAQVIILIGGAVLLNFVARITDKPTESIYVGSIVLITLALSESSKKEPSK